MENQRRDMKVLGLERDFFHFIPSDRHVHMHMNTHTHTLFFLPGALFESDNALIKYHFNIPLLQRRALKEECNSRDEMR